MAFFDYFVIKLAHGISNLTFVLPFSEPSQNSVKYLTWHRTSSFRSSSSRNLLATNSNNDIADPSKILFDNFCMVSGSHASTLDRLYAWEKKLYDEVKVSSTSASAYWTICILFLQFLLKWQR